MTAPSIPNVNVSNPEAQNVSVSSDSAEELDNISVTVSGAENATLTEEDFAYDATTGTYIATYEGSSGGIHTATLETADDAVSNDGTSCQSGSTEVDTSALLNLQTA